jgi:hypothetical protein
MVEWSLAFGGVPIHIHSDHRQWVMRPNEHILFWEGETREVLDHLTLIRTAGHFEGFQDLHWPAGADGRGVLLTGDNPAVCSDRRWVTFMYSFPNSIPLGPKSIHRIVNSLEPFPFDRIYGGWFGSIVSHDAKAVVRRSAERYLQAITV